MKEIIITILLIFTIITPLWILGNYMEKARQQKIHDKFMQLKIVTNITTDAEGMSHLSSMKPEQQEQIYQWFMDNK